MKKLPGKTVREAKAERVVELVREGKSLTTAAQEAGITLASLRKEGALDRVCRELLERLKEGKLLDASYRGEIVKSRLMELMMQDEDRKLALGAAKQIQAELGIGGSQVNVGVGVQLKTDPQVLKALQSLQLDVEGENDE